LYTFDQTLDQLDVFAVCITKFDLYFLACHATTHGQKNLKCY